MDAGATAYVIGSGSSYVANFSATNVTVGGTSSGNSLLIQLSSTLSGRNGLVGYGTSVDPTWGGSNAVTVSGSGSLWTNSGSVVVGQYGSDNTLRIEAGARVSGVGSFIGDGAPVVGLNVGNRNSAIVTGAGSQWTTSGTFFIGRHGSQNSLRIENGASASAAHIFVGGGTTAGAPPANGNSFVITGTGSTVTAPTISVGVSGSGNALRVENGAQLVATGTLRIGLGTGYQSSMRVDGGASVTNRETFVGVSGSSASLTISGPETTWSGTSLFLGYSGSGHSILIEDGAEAAVNNLIVGYGLGCGGGGHVLTVDGQDSVLTVKGDAYIGYAATQSSLQITSGGLVVVNGGLVIDVISTGSDYVRLDDGFLAWLGDNVDATESFVEAGRIQLWDGSAWVAATDLTLDSLYFADDAAGEAAAFALTGYHDLGGYTILAPVAVPEPSSLALAAVALAVAARRRRGRKEKTLNFQR